MSILKNLPDNFNILSAVSFRFETRKIPNVTYFVQTANIPGMSTSEYMRETPFKGIPTVGDTLEVETLDITFLVDEDLANYQEIISWLKGMTSPENFDNVFCNTSGVPTCLGDCFNNISRSSNTLLFLLPQYAYQ